MVDSDSDDSDDVEIETEIPDDPDDEGHDGDDENSSNDETGANSTLDQSDLLKDARGLFVWTEHQLELMDEMHIKLFGYQLVC